MLTEHHAAEGGRRRCISLMPTRIAHLEAVTLCVGRLTRHCCPWPRLALPALLRLPAFPEPPLEVLLELHGCSLPDAGLLGLFFCTPRSLVRLVLEATTLICRSRHVSAEDMRMWPQTAVAGS
jgi:hypothetical protein